MASEVLSPWRHAPSALSAAPVAAEAVPFPGFVGSGVSGSRRSVEPRSYPGEALPQYYPLSPRTRHAARTSLTGTGGSVANEPSRWLHSPSSLEASYAGLDPRRLALARQGPTPPPTPPAHRVGSLLQNIQEVPRTRPAFRPAGDTSTRGQGPADQVLAVDDEKKELLRRLQASDQRNHELELERQGLKNSLERMEKLLSDLVAANSHPAPAPLRASSPCIQSDARWHSSKYSMTPKPRFDELSVTRGSPPHYRGFADSAQWSRQSPRPCLWSPGPGPRSYSPPLKSSSSVGDLPPMPLKTRAPVIHSGYGLVTEPVTVGTTASTLEDIPSTACASQSWMHRDRYNLVDICQNLPPKLSRW